MKFISAALAALAVIAGAASHAQATQPAQGLRIVVIAGEDGVNIIQQKTAVRPIVEVRDRNDLPVAGVAVVFTIQGSGGGNTAAFAKGQSVFTGTSNAAGRVTASQMQPLQPGAVQIQVRANYQGQVATHTINQTNFATKADAVQAGRTLPPNTGGLVATIGTVGGIAAAGAGAALLVKESTANNGGCRSNQDAALSDITAAVEACVGDRNTPQCQTAAQRASTSLGDWCSCDGRVNVDAALGREGISLQQLDQAAGSLPRVRFPASCQ